MTTLQPVQVPSIQIPVIDPKTGLMNPAWQRMFIALTQLPVAIQELTAGASPYTYTASVNGYLVIKGGTVSSVTLTRGRTTIDVTGLSDMIGLGQNDQVEITYTVAPSVWFVPS